MVKHILVSLIRLVVAFALRGKDVYCFAGLRRSGNHACINWMANAVSQKSVVLQKTGYHTFQAGDLVLLNDVTFPDKISFLKTLLESWSKIRRARVIFISFEDDIPASCGHVYFIKKAARIFIQRNLLATMSSRLLYNINRARKGLDRGDMQIDETFFKRYRAIKSTDRIWSYEAWSSSEPWRRQFLNSQGLSADILPEMSSQGGGSSFHGRDRGSVAVMSEADRWNSVSWERRILTLLKDNEDLLTDAESEFIRQLKKP